MLPSAGASVACSGGAGVRSSYGGALPRLLHSCVCEHEIIPLCAEAEGTLDFFFFKFIQRRINDGWDANPTRPKSVIATEVYARLSTALQRGNADGAINWRYAEYGDSIFDSNSDPVRNALNSPAINMAECDKDLRERQRRREGAAEGAGQMAGAAVAAPEAGAPAPARGVDGPSAAAAAGVGGGGATYGTVLPQGGRFSRPESPAGVAASGAGQ